MRMDVSLSQEIGTNVVEVDPPLALYPCVGKFHDSPLAHVSLVWAVSILEHF